MLNLAVLLEDSARRSPGIDAVVCDLERLTYAELDARANQVAHLLTARGIEPGDKVALSCPNLLEFVICYYGIVKAGAVVVPLNILLRPREIAYHLDDAEAALYLCFEGTTELPMGEYGWEGFQQAPDCRDMVLITADPRARSPYPGVEAFARAVAELPGRFREQLAAYKYPRVVEFTATLPMTASGKILKRELAQAHNRITASR